MKVYSFLLFIFTFIHLIKKYLLTTDITEITDIELGKDYSGTIIYIPGGGLNNYRFYKLYITKELNESKVKDLMIQVKPIQTFDSISDPDIYISKVK